MVKVFIGADHAGFALKEKVRQQFPSFTDLSPKLDLGDDYPLVAEAVGRAVVGKKGAFGILMCFSGIGMSIAANKVRGIRAATCRTAGDAVLARRDNDANVVCLGSSATDGSTAKGIVEAFLTTPFAGRTREGERHKRRVGQIEKMEFTSSAP